ncbi:stage II sporulation protein M [Natrinema gelatinilyticum]|uniref:stage II sporulation protein M n=1 Tax=Natrinema gelatinilyticum TaxID=2961571 RepID=UPI003CE5C8CF
MIRTRRPDPPLTASIILFFAGVAVGLLMQSPVIPVDSPTGGERSIWFFFSRNAVVATLLYFGTLIFGIITSSTLLYNGFVVGYALSGSENVLYSIVLIVPHAIVELPAFWIAGAAGLRVPFEVNYPALPRSGLPSPRLLRTGLPASVSERAGNVPTASTRRGASRAARQNAVGVLRTVPDSTGGFP